MSCFQATARLLFNWDQKNQTKNYVLFFRKSVRCPLQPQIMVCPNLRLAANSGASGAISILSMEIFYGSTVIFPFQNSFLFVFQNQFDVLEYIFPQCNLNIMKLISYETKILVYDNHS